MIRYNGSLIIAMAALAIAPSLLAGIARSYSPFFDKGWPSTGWGCVGSNYAMIYQARKKNRRGKIMRRNRGR